jgi:hypothetical protein
LCGSAAAGSAGQQESLKKTQIKPKKPPPQTQKTKQRFNKFSSKNDNKKKNDKTKKKKKKKTKTKKTPLQRPNQLYTGVREIKWGSHSMNNNYKPRAQD